MNVNMFSRLSLMMFLEFFLWGAWWVSLGPYMGANPEMRDWIFLAYLSQPIGAMISPFFLGMVADQYFSTERVLATLHLIGGVLLAIAAYCAHTLDSTPLFITFVILHMLCFMPTMGLVNTLAFHNLDNQEKQFPYIRVFGTIGWIVSSAFLVSIILGADTTVWPVYIGAISAIVLGVYSLTLPHTPPPLAGQKVTARQALGLDAVKYLSSTPFWVFLIASTLISIPLATYYAFAGDYVAQMGVPNPVAQMSWGQASEVLFMLAMPLGFRYLGAKWLLAVGMLAWVIRYSLFGFAAPDTIIWMIIIGIALHGVCYDFFFVTGQIYVDKKSSPAIRGQAQGFLVFATLGVGTFIGMLASGWIFQLSGAADVAKPEGAEIAGQALRQSYLNFWLIPAAFAAVILILFVLFFKDRAVESQSETETDMPAEPGA